MREKQQKQLLLMESADNHQQEKELGAISKIIDATPNISVSTIFPRPFVCPILQCNITEKLLVVENK